MSQPQTVYPPVTIQNATPYDATGTVSYRAPNFCSPDSYFVNSNNTWEGPPRGICLVTTISATVNTSKGPIQATPYESTGTSFSRFAVIQTAEFSFVVVRISSGADDQAPEGYVDPTSLQK
jgi:hypothetical protein